MKTYEYMVTYVSQGMTGRICITRDYPIESYIDVESLDKTISRINNCSSLAIDFKLLRVYDKAI